MQNMLVAVDLHNDSVKLAEQAIALAGKLGAKLWFIHVAAHNPDLVGSEAGPQFIRKELAQHLREEHKQLQVLAEKVKLAGIESDGLLVQGATVETILAEANKLNASLIIAGDHRHSFMHNLFSESTS